MKKLFEITGHAIEIIAFSLVPLYIIAHVVMNIMR
jgi:hypothetical protein